MPNREEEIERIAREEVYPQRYKIGFPGEWPSMRHHSVCLDLAEKLYDAHRETEVAHVVEEPVKTKAVRTPKKKVELSVDELD